MASPSRSNILSGAICVRLIRLALLCKNTWFYEKKGLFHTVTSNTNTRCPLISSLNAGEGSEKGLKKHSEFPA